MDDKDQTEWLKPLINSINTSVANKKDIKRKTNLTLPFVILLIVATVSFSFYWFNLRPASIRKDCAEKVSTVDESRSRKNNLYRECLAKNGIKPESLFVSSSE